MKDIIETTGVNFYFGKFHAVKNLSLQIPEGSIYGFLGPNGAGKSTTIKLMLGLLHKRSGKIIINGYNLDYYKIDALSSIGSMVESPSLYEHLSGYDNLRLFSRILQIDEKRIDEVLDLTGMTKHRNKKVKKYSTGMKLRLGLALAMLSKPKILILDEPINGLDPEGIKEIRELMIHLNRDLGITIFLSSHILSEIEKTATHIGVLFNGELKFQGTVEELHELSKPSIEVETPDLIEATGFLDKMNIHYSVNEDGKIIRVDKTDNLTSDILVKELVNENIKVTGLSQRKSNLEQLYFELAGKGGEK